MINYPEEKVFLYYAQRQVIDFSQGGIFSDGFNEINKYVLDSTTPEVEIVWKDDSPLKEFTRAMIDEHISAVADENTIFIKGLIAQEDSSKDKEKEKITNFVASRFIKKEAMYGNYFTAYNEIILAEDEGRDPVGITVNPVWMDFGKEAVDWRQVVYFINHACYKMVELKEIIRNKHLPLCISSLRQHSLYSTEKGIGVCLIALPWLNNAYVIKDNRGQYLCQDGAWAHREPGKKKDMPSAEVSYWAEITDAMAKIKSL